MYRANMMLMTMCLRIHLFDLKIWQLTGEPHREPPPKFKRVGDKILYTDALQAMENLSENLNKKRVLALKAVELSTNEHEEKYGSNDEFLRLSYALSITDVYKRITPIDSALSFHYPYLFEEKDLLRANLHMATKVFDKRKQFSGSIVGADGFYKKENETQYFTDGYCDYDIVPAGFVMVSFV